MLVGFGGWGVGNDITHSVIPGEGSSHLPLFRKPSQKKQKSPHMCPRFLSDPCPFPVFAWAFLDFPAFYLWCTAGIQLLIFKGHGIVQTCSLRPLESLKMLCLLLFHPLKEVAWPKLYFNFMVKRRESSDQVICPLHVPLSPNNEWLFNGAHSVFCPWKSNITSYKWTQGRTILSQCKPGDHHTILFQDLCPPFPQEHYHVHLAQLQWVWTSKTSAFEFLCLQKLVIVISSQFPSQ